MKKVILLSTAVAFIGFTSCKKCQTCTTQTVQSYGGYEQVLNASSEYCGDEYDDAPEEGQYVNQQGGGVTQTVTITCSDN